MLILEYMVLPLVLLIYTIGIITYTNYKYKT